MTAFTNFRRFLGLAVSFIVLIALNGCGIFHPLPKPEIGPAGKPVEAKANPPFLERFASPPAEIYDLEAIAGTVFEGINKGNWPQAESGLYNLQTTWNLVKQSVGEKKGVKDADEALVKLASGIIDKRTTDSYESLTKFMGSAADVGKSYKLSPVSDLIGVGNSLRNVAFYVEDRNWSKAAAKVKELEDTWNQVKPSMEKVGILGVVTTTHSGIKQLKDSVNAENKGASEEHIASLNESLGYLREYYRGK